MVVKFTTIFRLKCKCAICQRTNWVHRLRLKANKTHSKNSQDQHIEENIFNILKLNQGDIVNNWCCGPYHCFDDFLIHFWMFFCVCVSICICICKLQERESACLVLWSISLPWASEHLWDTGRVPGGFGHSNDGLCGVDNIATQGEYLGLGHSNNGLCRDTLRYWCHGHSGWMIYQ